MHTISIGYLGCSKQILQLIQSAVCDATQSVQRHNTLAFTNLYHLNFERKKTFSYCTAQELSNYSFSVMMANKLLEER